MSNIGAAKKNAPEPSGWHGNLRQRLTGLALAIGALALLLVAAELHASSDGHGTHTQLGLAPCPWVLRWDMPCPSCGMTTAFAHAADGDIIAAGITQPMGALLALAAAVVFWGGLHTGLTGVNPAASFRSWMGTRLATLIVLLIIGAWIYKIIVWKTPPGLF